tara:strand:- start:24 stop:644 length:621 start_codon:yes stop_codon:yes gene_type:complete
MNIDIFFHKGTDNKQEFQFLGLKVANQLAELWSNNCTISLLKDYAGYNPEIDYDPQQIKELAMNLKSNVVKVANWLLDLSESGKTLTIKSEEIDDLKTEYSFHTEENGQMVRLPDDVLEFDINGFSHMVKCEQMIAGLVALGRMSFNGESYTSELLKSYADLLYYNGIEFFEYLMQQANKGRIMTNDAINAPEEYVERKAAVEPAA